MTKAEIERSFGACGLACSLCSYKSGCEGCCNKQNDECDVKACCVSKGLSHCFLCEEWPCDRDMHKGIRTRAFNSVARNEGLGKLAEYLYVNLSRGITYHRPDRLRGDYDRRKTEREVIDLLKNGKPDPYELCPEYETKSFLLRLVSQDDAGDLLVCYSDTDARRLFNSDNCTSDFFFSNLDEMRECIDLWLSDYGKGKYVRFAIVDKTSNKAVGTVEIFGGKRGVLRIDISSGYEDPEQLSELVSIADSFFYDFKCEAMLTKAVPEAAGRIQVLTQNGFVPYPKNEEWSHEHYYIKKTADINE